MTSSPARPSSALKSYNLPLDGPSISIHTLGVRCRPNDEFDAWIEESLAHLRTEQSNTRERKVAWVPGVGRFTRSRFDNDEDNSISVCLNIGDYNSVQAVRELFGANLLTPVRIDRCDVASDYALDLSASWFHVPRTSHRRFYSSNGDLESVNYGTRRSEYYLRIYDKAREQKLRGETLWRVEMQHNIRRGADPLPLTLFDRLEIKRPRVPSMARLDTKGLVALAASGDGWERRLPTSSRKKLAEIREQYFEPLEPPVSELYRRQRATLRQQIGAVVGSEIAHGLKHAAVESQCA